MRRKVVPTLALPLLALICLLSWAGGSSAQAAHNASAPRTTWTLVDYRQAGCFSPNVGDTYYGVYLDGRWRTSIDVGASGLPPGGSYTTSYAPIPPGSSNGEFTLAYVHVVLAPLPPVGRYTAALWADDGRSRQEVPIALEVKTKCGY
jgi:hypothetical protein